MQTATPDDELRLFRETATRWVSSLDDADPAERAPFDGGAELGLFSLHAPDSAGGLDRAIDALATVLRAIARVDAGVAAALLVHATGQKVVRSAGEWPEGIASSELVAWPAFDGVAPRIALDGRGRATGRLDLVPLAGVATHLVAFARSAEGTRLVAVRFGDAAVGAKAVDVLGLERCRVADVTLDGAEPSFEGPIANDATEELRASLALGAAAIALGLLEGSFETALAYARTRRQGGRTIDAWPEVRRMLDALRDATLVLDAALAGAVAASLGGDPRAHGTSLALAKHAIETACAGTTDGVQLLGGSGYMSDAPQERRMRDARQLRAFVPRVA